MTFLSTFGYEYQVDSCNDEAEEFEAHDRTLVKLNGLALGLICFWFEFPLDELMLRFMRCSDSKEKFVNDFVVSME